MKNKKIEILCAGMLETQPDCEPELAFRLLCLSSGVRRKDAENVFYERFGLSGRELLEAIQKGILQN